MDGFLPVLWVASAVVIVAAAVRSRNHPEAVGLGLKGVAFLFLVAGAAVNALFLMRGDDYSGFADGAYIAFVRDTWQSLVVPNHAVFIWTLVAFEAAVGVLALLGGRKAQIGLVASIGFHIGLLSFGWGFYLWSVPMVLALAQLLRRLSSPLLAADLVDGDRGGGGDVERADLAEQGDEADRLTRRQRGRGEAAVLVPEREAHISG